MTPLIYILAAVGAGMLNGLVAVSVKAAEQKRCRPASYTMVFTGMAALLSLVVAWRQDAGWTGAGFWALGLIGGGLYYGIIQSMMRANAIGPASLVWTVASMGLPLPILLSAWFLGEPLRPMDGALLVAFVIMLAAYHRGQQAANEVRLQHLFPFALALAAVFLCNGLLMFEFKLYEVMFPSVGTARLSFAMYGAAACLSAFSLLLRPTRLSLSVAELRLGAAAGLAGGGALLLLLPAMRLPAATVFPVVQGVGMLSGVILTVLIFRERLNAWKILGMALSLSVFLLAVFR